MFKENLKNTIQTMIQNAKTPREQGEYFEKLIILYLKNEPKYQNLFSDVISYANFAKQQNFNQNDTVIDLVAINQNSVSFTAINGISDFQLSIAHKIMSAISSE